MSQQHLEAEDGAAIVDKVELHVAAPADQLPLLLLLRELLVPVLLKNWHVGLGNCSQAVCRKLQVLVGVLGVEVVKEDATQAPRLLTMLDEEVLVGPLLELAVPVLY